MKDNNKDPSTAAGSGSTIVVDSEAIKGAERLDNNDKQLWLCLHFTHPRL
jgi:hypothetical protein